MKANKGVGGIRQLVLTLFCAWIATQAGTWAGDTWIWKEGENPSSSNFPTSTWLSPSSQAERDALSGGNIRTAANIRTTGPYWANYTIAVTEAGTYKLYARKFWEYAPFKWQFDSGSWTYASSQLQVMDSADYKPYWGLSWVYLGDVTLAAGSHTFRVRLDYTDWVNENEPDNIKAADNGGFDAFILSTAPFVPRGKLKPNQKYNRADPGKWNFESLADDFSSSAMLDLRSLNENVAGQSGFVRAAGDQSGKFVLGDGTPVRFWGVNVGNWGADFGSMAMQAKFLAKRGINLVRYHHTLSASNPTNINTVDPAYVDGAQRTVAAFKQEGIYTEFSLFYAANFTIRKEWGVDGYTEDKSGPTVVLMFDDKLKAAYKEWARQLFTPTNSYTGIPLAHDPAVAIIEIQNEDSFFFWTFYPSGFPQAQREKLEAKFGAFLTAKYGSLAAAQAAWGGVTLPNCTDYPEIGRMALGEAWYMTTDNPWFTDRMADQIQFLAELQRGFYQEMHDFYRNTLGCESLVEACNWTTADERNLIDVEHYTYTAADVIDKHPYFEPVEVASLWYGVSVGDCYQSIAVVTNPRSLPAAYKQVAGLPHIASETTWVNPTRFKAEGPMLIAAYNSMADVDGWIWFATGSLAYEDSESKWPVAVPSLMGQFPGAALLYRRGDVAAAPVAVREERNLSRMYHKERALISETATYDPKRNDPADPVYNPQTGKGQIDPLAMLVGRVECNYGTVDATNYVSPELLHNIDTTNHIVESLPVPGNTHGQLKLDWGKGLFQVNSPRSQGVAGFLSSVPLVDLDDVTITSSNEFGAILVISLDDLPIAQSKKILIQAMTEDNPYGWQEQDQVFTNVVNNVTNVINGKKIVSLGQPPMNVVNIMGAVTLKGMGEGQSRAVRVLDENGYDRGIGSGQVIGSDLRITLPTNSLYTVILRQETPVLTWADPADLTYPTPLGNTQLNATANVPGSFAYTPAAGTVLNAGSNQVLSVTFTPADMINYTTATGTVSLNVLKGSPQVTWATPADINYPTPLGDDQLNASANVPGSFAYTPAAGTVLELGNGQVLSVIFTPADTTNYTTATGTVSLNVLKGTPQISWASPLDIIYPTPLGDDQLNATANVPGNFDYTPAAGTVLNAGSNQVLSVTFTPADMIHYTTATGTVSLNVLKGSPRITWPPPADITYPTPLGNSQLNATANTPGSFAYTPAAGTVLSAGSNQVLSAIFTPADMINYTTARGTVSLNVLKGTPQVTWATPADITYPTQLGDSQLNATANVPGSFVYTPAAGTVLKAGSNQVLSAIFTPADTNSYTTATGTASLNVLKGTPQITWAPPADISYPTPLGDSQLNATANVPGSFVYTPAAGTVLKVGNGQPLSVTFTPADTSNYTTVTATASLNVLKGTPQITWAPPADITYPTPLGDSQLNATANMPGSFAYTPAAGTVLKVGNGQPLSVTFTPADTSNYTTATGTASLNVLKGSPQITWATPADITYPTPLGNSQLNATANVPGSFAYTPAAGTVLKVGNGQPLSVTFTPADTSNYTTATGTASLNVLKGSPQITWATPADITYPTPLGDSQLNATANVPGSFAYTPAAGTVLNAGSNQVLSVAFTPADMINYTMATGTASLNVLKGSPQITWATPADITYPTPLGNSQLNGTANVPGGFAYTPAAGTVLNAGSNQVLTVSFTPADTNSYTGAKVTVSLNVLKAEQTIMFDLLGDRMVGETFNLTASASSGEPVTFEIVSGPAVFVTNTVLVTTVTVTNVGVVTIRASQAGTTNYNAAPDVLRSFTVSIQQPSLHITLSGGQFILSWPSSASGFTLESAATLQPRVTWATVSNGGPIVVVTNQLVSTSAFYRLRWQ